MPYWLSVLRSSVLFDACLISKVFERLQPFEIYRISMTPTYTECGPEQVFGLLYGVIRLRLCGRYLSISSGPYAQVL
jgi:hypothetical protein